MLILTLNIAIPASENYYKAIAGVLILVVILKMQEKLKPYQRHMVNELEQKEILASMITLYGATLFLQDDNNQGFKIVASVFILLLNANFYLFWIFCFLKGYENKHPYIKKATFFFEHYLTFKDKGMVDNNMMATSMYIETGKVYNEQTISN